MTIPNDFTFTQSNLQDYLDCPRRFELKYLQRIPWPAIQTESVTEFEEAMARGQLFHQLLHQFFIGIPAETLATMAGENGIADWWSNFRQYESTLSEGVFFPEFTMGASFEGHRLIAKYDLLHKEADGRVTIFDWKTTHKILSPLVMRNRIQSILYPFTLVLAGASSGIFHQILPENVRMSYWYAEHPDSLEQTSYSNSSYATDRRFLSRIIDEIVTLNDNAFPLTSENQVCSFCNYRSFCDREFLPGRNDFFDPLSIQSENFSFPEDFDSIQEIEF